MSGYLWGSSIFFNRNSKMMNNFEGFISELVEEFVFNDDRAEIFGIRLIRVMCLLHCQRL